MSLDEFFKNKSKKKARVITTNSLLEQIKDTRPILQPETETNVDLLPIAPAESDEWEPIQDIIPDLSELSLHDLEEDDNEDAVSSDAKDASKSNGNEVAWKNKPKTEEKPKETEIGEPAKPSVYVPAAFRKNRDLPNVDSMDDFPTLDSVKDKPAKKVEKPVEPVDNSWTDVRRGSNRRLEEQGSTYVPPAFNRSDGRSKYIPPSLRDGSSGGFPSRNGIPSERSDFNIQQAAASSSSGWTRGSTIKREEVVSRAPMAERKGTDEVERKSGVIPATKPYVPPSLRNAQPISQSNRFAQLNNS